MEAWRPLRQVRVHPLTVDGAVPVLSFCELPSDNLYPKLKPRWDVHFQVLGNRAGGFSGVSRPLIAGRSGSAV